MRIALLAIAGAAVAVTAVPASARRHPDDRACAKHENGRCVAWRDMDRRESRRAEYRVGYDFGPSYAYTDFDALPQPLVAQHRLRDNFRYVHSNGYVYVVNPHTYRVVRVIRG